MIAVSTSPINLSMFRKRNTWYTIADGNWSDPNIWISNGKRKYSTPQVNDNVYVNNVVTLDGNVGVNDLYISGIIKGTDSLAFILSVGGDCQVSETGLIDLSLQFNNLILNGFNNIIPSTSFSAGSYSTVTYSADSNQPLLNIPYQHLTTINGDKYQVSDITVSGNFNQQSNYECGAYNLTIYGSSTIGTVGAHTFTKNSPLGSILFIGAVDFEGATDLSVGNPNVEFRGGLAIHTFMLTTGTGTFTFTTNNQTLNSAAYLGGIWNANVLIQGDITVNITGGYVLPIHGSINGTSSASTLNNSGTLYLGNGTLPMMTGIFNYQYSPDSTLGYIFDGDYSLPYNSYANLVVDGQGTKTQSGNTVISKNLTIQGGRNSAPCIYECNGYDLNVKGSFVNTAHFKSNAVCNILFEGIANWINGSDTSGGVDLRSGNPTVEFRNGLIIHANITYTGNGLFNFTTNNQNIDFSANNGGLWDASILISGAISLIFLDGTNLNAQFINGSLNGNNPSSKFINKGNFYYSNPQQPMQTGMLSCNEATNLFVYNLDGNQDITSGTYNNLSFSVGGSKKLLGDVSVTNNYNLLSPATVDLNGHVLTNP